MKYSLSLKEIPRAKPEEFPVYPDSSHNTDILNYNSSIVLPGRAILEELILRIALAAGAIFSSILPALLGVYWKIYPQLYWEYILQYTPSRAGSILENIAQLIEPYWRVKFQYYNV